MLSLIWPLRVKKTLKRVQGDSKERSRNEFGMTKCKRVILKQFWDDKMGKGNPETRLG